MVARKLCSLMAMLLVTSALVLGASTPASKRMLVDISIDGEDFSGEKVAAVQADISSDGTFADVEAEDDLPSGDAEAANGAVGGKAKGRPTAAPTSERLPFLSGAAARVAKVWHAAASGKRLPRFRDARTHKIAKAARTTPDGDVRDQDVASVYVVGDPMDDYAAGSHAAGAPTDEDDPMLQQGHPHHPDSGYMEADAGVEPDLELLYVRHRLQKLDFYFEFLKVMSEDCRQRMLCEVSREPTRFYPLSSVLEDATSFSGSYQYVSSHLINTTEGARLLSYIEASYRGQDRGRSCAVFQYRCPAPTEDMINYDALCLWREMVRWLTIHIVAPNN